MKKRDMVAAEKYKGSDRPASPATKPVNAGAKPVNLSKNNAQDDATRHIHSYFLANITHEFRTPLSALNASVEYLLDEFNQLSREEIQELLKSIHLSVTGLQTLIDNLIESANIEADRFTIRPRPIKLENVIAEAVRVMLPLVDRRQQRLAIDMSSKIPLVYGDHTRVTQVLVNLLSNASKFGPMGQTINLTAQVTGDNMVLVAVADRGPGIPPGDRANIFHRFLRLDSPNGAQYGIGLGLSVVKIIVEEHGGQVGVEERPGGGSVFWFTVPIADDEMLLCYQFVTD